MVNVACLNDGCCGFEFDFYNEYFISNNLLYTGVYTLTHIIER